MNNKTNNILSRLVSQSKSSRHVTDFEESDPSGMIPYRISTFLSKDQRKKKITFNSHDRWPGINRGPTEGTEGGRRGNVTRL